MITFEINKSTQWQGRSGVYMGGIGAGGFEPRPDGLFFRNQMTNEGHIDKQLDLFFMHKSALGVHALQLDEFRQVSGVVPGVDSIIYEGNFPYSKLSFPGHDTSIAYSSFFVPGNPEYSSLPSVKMNIASTGMLMMVLRIPAGLKGTTENGTLTFSSPFGGFAIHAPGHEFRYCSAQELPFMLMTLEGYDYAWPVKPEKTSEKGSYMAIVFRGTVTTEVVFSWYWPQWVDRDGLSVVSNYGSRFTSVEDVNRYVLSNLPTLCSETQAFSNRIENSGVPGPIKDAYRAQLATFVKQSRYLSDGSFGVWEGACEICGLQTTDVSYYGSWLYVDLFPELERTAIGLTAQFQRDSDGWISHLFPGTFSKIDDYKRKDMNMQFVLMAYRDWKIWNDQEFLKKIYPHVKKAIACVYTWIQNDDLLPEVEAMAQTFDAWGFKGCSMYLASLWAAALRMGAVMAQAMGDIQSASTWTDDAAIVINRTIHKFWNGEYFILSVEPDGKKDECCLIDALSGDWYCRMLGLEQLFPNDMVVSHIKSVLKYNHKSIDRSFMRIYSTPGEVGQCLINGGYPDNRRVCFQQFEPWTGLEYAFASYCYLMGMKNEAFAIVENVMDRLCSAGQTWNHIECGGEYFRAMSIGALWRLCGKDQ